MMRRVLSIAPVLAIVILCFANGLATPVESFTLPAGATLRVRLGTSLSGKDAQTGDRFTGDVAEPIISGGEEVVPTGSMVEGGVFVTGQDRHGKNATELRLALESIATPAGVRYSIVAANEPGVAGSDAKATAKTKPEAGKEGGSGRGPGPLYVVITPTAAGGVRSVLRKRQEIEVSPGTEFDFVAKRDVIVKKSAQSGEGK